MLHWARFHLFDTKYDQLDTFHGAGFVLSMLHRSNLTCFSVPYSTFRYEIGPNGHHWLGQNSPFDTTKVLPDTFCCASWHHLVLWSTPLCKRDMFQCTGSDKLIPKRSNRQRWRGQFRLSIRNRPNLACCTGLDFTFWYEIGPTWNIARGRICPFHAK